MDISDYTLLMQNPDFFVLKALTNREKQIALLLKQGLSPKVIANRLQIGVKTVYAHSQNIIKKTKTYNIREGITIAIKHKMEMDFLESRPKKE